MLRSAARVAYTFDLDPVDVLSEQDTFLRAVRASAHNVVMADLREASKPQQGR